jgi:nicotinamidase-related amidase
MADSTQPPPITKDETHPPILLLIDLQQGLISPLPEWKWGPRSTPSLESTIITLLKTFRAKNYPIIHVHHDDTSDPSNPISTLYPAPQYIQPHACAAPIPGEKTLIKHTGSAFVNTTLSTLIPSAYLKSSDPAPGKIIVVGMDGSQCVNSTVRSGIDLGYDMIVVGDGCASFGIEKWVGGEMVGVDAEETNSMAMGMLSGYTKVVTAEELFSLFDLKAGED